MMLSDGQIFEYLESGKIKIWPSVKQEDIRPTGIRLHLSKEILIPDEDTGIVELDGSRDPSFTSATIDENGLKLTKGDFVLASTIEHIKVDPNIVCMLDGRSTLARLGLMIHCGSIIFDQVQHQPRSITLELLNLGRFEINLRIGQPIALITFTLLTGPIIQPEHKQYARQSGPTAPLLGYGQTRDSK
jgi:dCTP deaminase